MSLTRRHFEAVAEMLGTAKAYEEVNSPTTNIVDGLTINMMAYFRNENVNFDGDRFHAAVINARNETLGFEDDDEED